MEPKMLVIDAADAFKVTAQALHNKLKRDKLDYKKNKNRIYFTHKTAKALFNLRFKQQIISFQIVKGGTGKTTLCLSLGIRES